MAAAAPSPTPTPDAVSAGGDDDRDESEGDDAGEALSNDALVAEMAGMDVGDLPALLEPSLAQASPALADAPSPPAPQAHPGAQDTPASPAPPTATDAPAPPTPPAESSSPSEQPASPIAEDSTSLAPATPSVPPASVAQALQAEAPVADARNRSVAAPTAVDPSSPAPPTSKPEPGPASPTPPVALAAATAAIGSPLGAPPAPVSAAAVGATSPVSELQFVAVAGRNAFSCTTRVPALNAALAELNRHNEEVNWVALAGTAWVVIYGGGRGYKGVLGKELGEKLTTIVSAGGEITCVSLSMSSNTAGAAATDEWVVVSTTADGSTECSYRLVAARQPLADAAKEVIEFEGGAVDRVALAPDGGWALTWRRRDAVRSYGGARFAISATHHETFKASLAQCMDGVTCIAMAAGGAYSIVGGDGRCLFRATAESVRALKTAVETVGEGGKVTCLAIA